MIHRYEKVADQFSRVVVHDNTVYVAGLVSDQPGKDIEHQCVEVLNKLDELLVTAGTSRSSLLSMTVFLKTFEDYERFKVTYAAWADPENLPVRATLRADMRDPGMRIEIMAIAACQGSRP
jgi:enamine deaminase RidA (YjgF/YER057c/UK114 family)